MKITEIKSEKEICLQIEGRIDTNTSPDLQEAVLKAFQKRLHIVMDFKGVDYISSAGLRVILIGQKTADSKGGTIKYSHICENVRYILDMSGFSSIITIEK